jgi:hypothetical protein
MFFIPLAMIALYEASFHTENIWTKNWLQGMDAIEEDSAQIRDPDVPDDECNGMKISKVPYAELIKVFPDTQQVGRYSLINVCLFTAVDDSRVPQQS